MAGSIDATERGRKVTEALLRKGRELGFDAVTEYPVQGGRLDVVWLLRPAATIPGLDEALPVAGFEIESSWQTRKHIKGDYLNLADLSAALGVIVLLGDGEDVDATRRFASILVDRPGPRILVWSERDVDMLMGETAVSTNTASPSASTTLQRSAHAEHPGKYRGLWAWLRTQPANRVPATFAQIEEVIGMPLPRSCWHVGELLTGAARFGDGVSAFDRHAAVDPVEVELDLVTADRHLDKARTRKRRQREIIREPVHETIIPDEVGLAANFSPASRVSAEASVQAPLTRSGRSPEHRWQTVGVTEAGLPELDMARVRRWCQQRVPEHARSQVKVECDVAPRQLTIVECRPPWRQDTGAEWTRFPIARLRYTKATRQWSLYWRDRHLRFHLYDRMMPSPRIDDLLREIDRDPTGIFWG